MLKSYSRNRFSRSVSTVTGYQGNHSLLAGATRQPISHQSDEDSSGMGGVPSTLAPPKSIRVTERCVSVYVCVIQCRQLFVYDYTNLHVCVCVCVCVSVR